jgi:tetratricopeptide (TPR) repeat protein
MNRKKIKPKTSAQSESEIPGSALEMTAGSNSPLKWIALGLFVLAGLLYANTLGHGYVMDDVLAISENDQVQKGISGIWDIFSTNYRAGTARAGISALLYRPLSLAMFAIEWSLAPNSPFVGHLMNVLLYAATAALLFYTLLLLLRGYHWLWPAGAALLFTIHPLHTEVVANIKSRDEILCLFFCLAALYAWLRVPHRAGWAWIALSLFLYFLALLSKESAVTFLPIFPLAGWFFFDKTLRQSAIHTAILSLPVIVFLIIRSMVFAQTTDAEAINPMDNPIVNASGIGERTATGFMALWYYFRLLVFPHPLLCDYSYQHLTVVNWTSWRAVAGLVIYSSLAVLAIFGLIRRRPEGFFTLAFLSSIALYSQLVVVIGTLLGERLMYAPSVWFCAGAMLLLLRGSGWALRQGAKDFAAIRAQRGGLAVVALLALATVLMSLKTVIRNTYWADNLTLFSADAQLAPKSFRIQNGIGNSLMKVLTSDSLLSESDRGRMLDLVEFHSRTANAIRPDPNACLNLGNVAFIRKQYQDAILWYDSSLVVSTGFEQAKNNLAKCYLVLGKQESQNKNHEKASEMYRKSLEYNADIPETHIGLGNSYGRLGRPQDAIACFEKTIELDPGNLYAWRFLAFAYRVTGDLKRAAACEEKVRTLETNK